MHFNLYHWFRAVLFFFILLLLCSIYFNDLLNHPLHMDEHEWVRRGAVFFEKYFIDIDFSERTWKSYEGYDQFMFAQYVYGAWIKYQFKDDLMSVFQQVSYNQGWEGSEGDSALWSDDKWWIRYSNFQNQFSHIPFFYRPAFQLIVLNRYVSVFFAMGILGLMYLIGLRLSNYWVGIFAMIMLAMNSLFYWLMRQAMLEAVPLFFNLLLLWVYLILHQHMSRWRVRLLIGLFAGLAVSSKVTGAIFVLGIFFVETFRFLRIIWGLSLVSLTKPCFLFMQRQLSWLLVALGVLFILNPVLWGNPIMSLQTMVEQRIWHLSYQSENYPQYYHPSIADRLQSIYAMVVAYDAPLSEIRLSIPRWHELRTLFLIIGLLHVTWIVFDKKKLQSHYWAICGLVFLTVYFTLGLFLVVGFDRYYLPLIPFIILVTALGLWTFLHGLADMSTFCISLVRKSFGGISHPR